MTASLTRLVETWQRQPDEQTTITLCRQLGDSGEIKLVDEVGKRAAVKYASNPQVLVAVACMYLNSSRLGDAQGLLVSAGKMAPKNAEVYRWLGEVLLRRGDAARAAKVLERAVVLGKIDADTVFWRNQAEGAIELQKRSGGQAVIAALSEELVKLGHPPIRPSTRAPRVPPPPPARAENLSDSDVTVVRQSSAVLPDVPAPPRRASAGAPRQAAAPPAPPLVVVARAMSPFAPVGPSAISARPITVPAPTPSRPSPSRAPMPPAPNFSPKEPASRVPPRVAPEPPRAPTFQPASPSDLVRPSRPPSSRSPSSRSPLADAGAVLAVRAGSAPPPRDVLNALALTGVFEPSGGGAAAWDNPGKPRTRFAVTLVALTVILVGAGIGLLKYVGNIRGKKAEEAQGLDTAVETLLREGKVTELTNAENQLSRAFDLEANSGRTALLWVRDRMLRTLEVEGESQGIDTAMNRARQTGVPEADLAFARIGSFVAQGDTAGAAALLPQWDGPAKGDPYFQLLAGAALERAGDLRAIERFQLAANLDPTLVPAQIMLARALILEGDRAKGLELARAFRAKWPDRAEGAALIALAWARDPARGAAPTEAEQAKARREELPVSLRSVPSAIEALQAIDLRADAEAKAAIERALSAANTPGIATWLGSLALQMGDDVLARRAALQAVSFSAIYPQARVLAARVALAGGRLDEALNAVTELDSSSPDVAIVRATAAYERLDVDGAALAIEALSPELRSRPELAALARATDVLRGTVALDTGKIRALAGPEVAWGDLIALDAALDSGNLALAKELVDRFHEKSSPPHALRLARYLRYTDRAAADAPSKAASGLPTARSLIERVLVLVATNKGDEARSAVAKNATLLGPMTSWILAYIDANGPRAAEARSKAALLDPPAAIAPLPFRIVTALTMSELGDKKRGADLVRSLAKVFPKNPDVIAAANALRH